MKKLIAISLIGFIGLTGCTDVYKMKWAKSNQFCTDNNSTVYDFHRTRVGIRVSCKNGLIKDLTRKEFNDITGETVSTTIEDFWKDHAKD